MKSVCVIGAGPGGLVAAKTLLQNGFNVTILEKSNIVGGIWAFQENDTRNAYLGADTPSNLARDFVVFSDLAWDSIGLLAGHLRLYPTAAQLGKYLEAYRTRYIPESVLKFDHKVVSALRNVDNGKHKWSVTSINRDGERRSAEYDFLLNAAGFFSKPKPVQESLAAKMTLKNIHTSQFRNLKDLFPSKDVNISGRKILIYGCGNSSGETAGNIAFQLSSALYSPSSTTSKGFADVQVCHVTPRPIYAMPPYVPFSTVSNTFASYSMLFYDLKTRPDGPIRSSSGWLSEEQVANRSSGLRGIIGNQTDLGAPALVATDNAAPYVVVSEEYTEFVRLGKILPVAGRLVDLEYGADSDSATAIVETAHGDRTEIKDVVAIVNGTGYTNEPALAFLDQNVKHALEYELSSTRLPILLQQHQTINPAVPNLGFVGFYEGPYWGVMEMQARLIAAQWSDNPPIIPNPPAESFDNLRCLRKAMHDGRRNVPPYWFMDCVGYVVETAQDLGLERHDHPFTAERDGVASIARYLASGDNRDEAQKTRQDAKRTRDACMGGKYRARAVFRAMQGKWQLTRTIDSARPELPSGTFRGTASFHPRVATSDEADFESLYIETGTFVTISGFEMTASRRYVYRYTEASDTLSVWFVKPDDNLSVDYLFHDLAFGPVEKHRDGRCTAHAEHLCTPDYYTTDYTFNFRAIALAGFELRHLVTGPNKDYVAKARYER